MRFLLEIVVALSHDMLIQWVLLSTFVTTLKDSLSYFFN